MISSVRMNRLIPKLKPKAKSLSLDTKSSFQKDPETQSSTSNAPPPKPIVKAKNWEAIYDPTLSTYYFYNSHTRQTQYDHPDEVLVSPSSPSSPLNHRAFSAGDAKGLNSNDQAPEHRRSLGLSLKRTLSPRFLHSDKSVEKVSPKPSTTEFASYYLNGTHPVSETSPRAVSSDCDSLNSAVDQDVLEFQMQLEQEMRDYEKERIRNK